MNNKTKIKHTVTRKRSCTELCPHPNSYAEALIPNVIVGGGEAFGRYLGLDEAIGQGPADGISALIKRHRRAQSLSSHAFLPCYMRTR